MKITREQYNKWNAAAKNDFEFDLDRFVVWNEKELVKWIPDDDAGDLQTQYRLIYTAEFQRKQNQFCSWNEATGRHIPTLHISKWRRSASGCFVSNGIGKFIHIGLPVEKKNYSLLCKYSGMIDLEALPDYDAIQSDAAAPAGLVIA